jgi:hypothetical protein
MITVGATYMKSAPLVKMEWIVAILKGVNFRQCLIFYNDKGRGEAILAEIEEAGISH